MSKHCLIMSFQFESNYIFELVFYYPNVESVLESFYLTWLYLAYFYLKSEMLYLILFYRRNYFQSTDLGYIQPFNNISFQFNCLSFKENTNHESQAEETTYLTDVKTRMCCWISAVLDKKLKTAICLEKWLLGRNVKAEQDLGSSHFSQNLITLWRNKIFIHRSRFIFS